MDKAILKSVHNMTRREKAATILGVDIFLVFLSQYLALAASSNAFPSLDRLGELWLVFFFQALSAIPIAVFLGIPNVQLKAYESRELGKTALFGCLLAGENILLSRLANGAIPPGASVVFGVIFIVLSASSRIAMLQILLAMYRRAQPTCRVLIYGAGSTGLQLASALRTHHSVEPVAFVDDSPALQSITVAGLPVHRPAQIAKLARDKGIDRVLLAIPSLSPPKQARLARQMQQLGLEVQALPSFAQLVGQEQLIDSLGPVLPGRFLGRDRLDKQLAVCADSYEGRTLLVTGAGGSIGSELCRQLLLCRPKRIVLFEMNELALFTADMELRELAEGTGTEVVAVLGSVTDPRASRAVMQDYRPDVVFHAAAYKHVPLVEANPLPGLANNVLGTRTIAEAASDAGVARFILISSDKAVRPTNVMGASKRLAELVVQDLATRSAGTAFSVVRFGNVLGSSGSVIPLFREQISKGGPITLTDERVTRYFMTVQEAVGLVLLAGSFKPLADEGGDVFVLDMGKPIRIRDLAEQMIEVAGYTLRGPDNPEGDIEIKTIGLRPGEKLHEELLIGDGLLTTPHPKILRAQEAGLSEIEVASALRALRQAVDAGDANAAREVAARWVEGYDAAVCAA